MTFANVIGAKIFKQRNVGICSRIFCWRVNNIKRRLWNRRSAFASVNHGSQYWYVQEVVLRTISHYQSLDEGRGDEKRGREQWVSALICGSMVASKF